jgi:hypothetical protein
VTAESRRAYIRGKEHLIAMFVLQHPAMPRTLLAEKMAAGIRWGGKPPEIEVLERKISRYRNLPVGHEEQPWSLGSLGQYPIPAAALPTIVDMVIGSAPSTLSIREAKWIGRLHAVQSLMSCEGLEGREKLSRLVEWARIYAANELLSKWAGEDSFDSRFLDSAMSMRPSFGAILLSPAEIVDSLRPFVPYSEAQAKVIAKLANESQRKGRKKGAK